MERKKKVPKECTTKSQEECIIELGKFYFLNGKYDAAIAEFEKARKFDPKNAELYYNIGIAYEAKNEISMAKDMYLKCLELNDKHTLAREHLDRMVGV